MSAEAIAIAGVGVALLAVLVPLLLTLHRRVVGEIAEMRRDLLHDGANRPSWPRKLVNQSKAIRQPPREKAEIRCGRKMKLLPLTYHEARSLQMMGKVVTIMVSFASLSAGAIVTHGLNLWLQQRAFAAHVPVFLLLAAAALFFGVLAATLYLKSDDVIAQIERELVDDD